MDPQGASKPVSREPSAAPFMPYMCMYCKVKFINLGDLGTHVQSHQARMAAGVVSQRVGERTATGVVGQRVSPSEGRQVRDLDTHREGTPEDKTSSQYLCDLCGHSYRSQASLKKHMDNHQKLIKASNVGHKVKTKKLIGCQSCAKTFTSRAVLKKHMTLSHSKDLFCPYCDEKFHAVEAFNRHVYTHTNTHPYTCHYCDVGFFHETKLRAHLYARAHGPPLICTECCQGFSHPSALRAHMSTHTGQLPFVCPYCGEGFSRAVILKRHVRSHKEDQKPADTQTYTCEECGRGFPSLLSLTHHQRTHAGFTCPDCGQKLKSRFQLKGHRMVHAKYGCPSCERRYDKMSELKAHLKTNQVQRSDGGRVHVFPFCGDRCGEERAYYKHLTGCIVEVTEVCPICQRTFNTHRALQAHMAKHGVRAKPHTCPTCGETFRRATELRQHSRSHYVYEHRARKKFKDCRACVKGFESESDLKLHLSFLSKEMLKKLSS